VSKGPGAANLLTALLSASRDGVPLVVASGNVARACHGRNGFQEFNVSEAYLAAGAVKAACYCGCPEELPVALAGIVAAAYSLPCGPALIDLPYDLLAEPCALPPIPLDFTGGAHDG